MDEPGEYYARLNKSNREIQISSNFTHMWNLKKKKMSKHNKRETDS